MNILSMKVIKIWNPNRHGNHNHYIVEFLHFLRVISEKLHLESLKTGNFVKQQP